jgi:aspartate dehydrogenase
MKAGIIGCGFIGNELAIFIDKSKELRLIGVNDIDKKKANDLVKRLKNNKPKSMELNDLIKKCDLIIESATKNVIKEILSNKNLDKSNKSLLIMSTGGLINNFNLLNKIKNCRIYLPSGAIAGLDAIKTVSGRIKSLTLTTTKPIKGLKDAPYILKKRINLEKIKTGKVVFEGNLKDAVNRFPQNINVAATLFLASKFRNIRVKIIADPDTKFNTHEIKAVGDFGEINAITRNMPSKNTKTSYLAVLSAINILKTLKNNVRIGN